MLSLSHIVLIMIGVVLIFGSKRFPEIMKNLGKGLDYFKKGIEDASSNKSDNHNSLKKKPSSKKDKKS
jgi:TatA/E family protein of Tat protein translocase